MRDSAVYDDQKQDAPPKRMDDEGAKPLDDDERAKLEDIENNFGADGEEPKGNKSSGNDTSAEDGESQALGDRLGNESGDEDEGEPDDGESLYKPDKKKKTTFRSRFTKKRALLGGGITGGVVGIAAAGIIALPNIAINTLREVLLGKVSELQTSQSLSYRRSKYSKITDVFSKDGRRGGRVISEMEARGYQFKFADPVNKNKITGITLPDGKSSIFGDAVGAHISDYMEVKHPLKTARWKTKRMDAFYNRYGVSRVSVVKKTPSDLEDPDKTVNRSLAGNVYEDEYNPAIQGDEGPVEGETDADAEAREARNQAKRDIAASNDGFDEIKADVLDDGTPIREIDSDLARSVDGIATGTSNEVLDLANKAATSGSVGGKIWGGIKSLGAADILDKVCTISNRLYTAVANGRNIRAAGQLKNTMAYVNAADDLRTNDASPKLVASLMKRVTAVDRNGNSIGASPGFSYALKKKFSKGKNDGFKSGYADDGQLTGTYKGIQDVVTSMPGIDRSKCGVYQNPLFQGAAGALEIGFAIFSGGSSSIASNAAKAAAKEEATQLIKIAIKKVINKTVAKAFLKQAVVDLTFEGAMALTQIYAEKTFSFNVTTQEVGGELGGVLGAGAGVANKQRSLQAGMVPAKVDQYVQAESKFAIEKAEKQRSKSFFARVLDFNDPDSVAFNLAWSVPASPEQFGILARNSLTNFSSIISRAPTSLLASISSAFGSKAFAEDTDVVSFETYTTAGDHAGTKLATDPAGNLLPIMRTDIEAIDPETNATQLIASGDIDPVTLEPSSSTFKAHLQNCVYGVDILSVIEWSDPNDPATDCLATNPKTVMFKAHLAYLDMLDGIEAEFMPETLGTAPQPTTPTGSGNTTLNAPGLNGYAIPCTGQPHEVVRRNEGTNGPSADWSGIEYKDQNGQAIIGTDSQPIRDSGTIGMTSQGKPIKVYIREACDTANAKTVVVVSSIHGSENGGQFISNELLFNTALPSDVRIVAIPELNGDSISPPDRQNARGVDLNRNNDYAWASLIAGDETVPGSKFYKGTAPGSEPETVAINSFLTAIGKASLSLHYHDDLDYVAPVGSTPTNLASTYASKMSMHLGNKVGDLIVTQRGSLDAWYNSKTGTPAILVEMNSNQSQTVINKHVEAIKAVLAELN